MLRKYFSPVCGLSFHTLKNVIWRTEVLNFDNVYFINFFKRMHFQYLRNYCLTQDHIDFLLNSLLKVL